MNDLYIEIGVELLILVFYAANTVLGYIFWKELRPEIGKKIKGISARSIWDSGWILYMLLSYQGVQDLIFGIIFVLIIVLEGKKNEEEILRLCDANMNQRYEETRQMHLDMQIIRHDWKNHLLAINALVQEENFEELKQYMSEISETIEKSEDYIFSGNSMTDAILNQKIELAKSKNICIDLKCDLLDKLKLSDKDICMMLANLLDNAIEAAEKVEENRRIEIRIAKNKSMFLLKVANSTRKKQGIIQSYFATDKKDKKLHGFGLLSVERIVKQYEGNMEIVYDDTWFETNIIIYDGFH